MNPELIRFARKHRYEIAEGFCMEGKNAEEWQTLMESSLDKLSPEYRELFDIEAEHLSRAAGIPLDEAYSAVLNFAVETFLRKRKAQLNN